MIRTQTRTWLGALGILVVLSTLTLLHGIWGLVGGLAIGLSWYTLPPVYAFTIGQFTTVAVTSQSATTPVQVAILEIGLISILLTRGVSENHQLRTVVLTGLGISLGVSLVWGIVEWGVRLWQTAVVITVGFGLLTYGLHRYEQLELGLIEEAT